MQPIEYFWGESAMRSPTGFLLSCIFLLLTLRCGTLAQTRQFLDAPVVEARIRVRWNAAEKAMQWEADNREPFRAIQSDAVFLTKRSIYVTYPHLNPLNIQATASAVAVDDPSYATITKLIEAITSVATTVAPALPATTPSGAAPPKRAPCSSASSDIHDLYVLLYGKYTTADEIRKQVSGWNTAIDSAFTGGKSGPQAIADGIAAIKGNADSFQKSVDQAKADWAAIQSCATDPSTPTSELGLYTAVSLNDQNPRIQQLTALVGAENALIDLLNKQYAPDEKWQSSGSSPLSVRADFVISQEIGPTFAKMQTVTVKVMNVTLKVDTSTSALSTDQQLAATATFNVRRYSSFAPEVGVGAVFGTIKQPKYGTGTNSAGQTVVTHVSDTSLSVNPTILANFVCRCGTGLLVPMLQMGAAVSKDLPAILTGGGFRLFGLGKGDVAIGGGAMFGWFKDLRKLHVGDVVTGTAAIDSDLGYSSTPKVGGYFAIQYKF